MPESLLLKIAQAQAQTPLPVLPEPCCSPFFTRSCGRACGHPVPLGHGEHCGGLVMGDTAVAAGAGQRASLLVVAACAVGGLRGARLYEPPLPAAGGLFGPRGALLGCGAVAGLVALLLDLCGSRHGGAPCSPVSPTAGGFSLAGRVPARANWGRLSGRPCAGHARRPGRLKGGCLWKPNRPSARPSSLG